HVAPVLEGVGGGAPGPGEEIHRVEAAHQRGGASGGTRGEELALDQHHPARLPARQMAGHAGSVHSSSDDDDVRGSRHVWHWAPPGRHYAPRIDRGPGAMVEYAPCSPPT